MKRTPLQIFKRSPLKFVRQKLECFCFGWRVTRMPPPPGPGILCWFVLQAEVGHWHYTLIVMSRPKTNLEMVSEAMAIAAEKCVFIPFPKARPQPSAQSYSSN